MSITISISRTLDYTISVVIVAVGVLVGMLAAEDSGTSPTKPYEILFFFYLGAILLLANRNRSSLALFRVTIPVLVKLSYPEWKHMPMVYAVVSLMIATGMTLHFIF